MGIYAIKPWFRGRLAGITDALVRRGVSADTVTGAGLVAATLGGWSIWAGTEFRLAWLAVPLFAFLRIMANALDGLVAQASGTARPAGELFNETADRLGDFAFIGAVGFLPGLAGLAFAALAAAELASFVGVTAKAAGGTRRYDGPMGKPDRMAVVSVVAVVAAVGPRLAWRVGLWVILVGAVVTAANRYRKAFT